MSLQGIIEVVEAGGRRLRTDSERSNVGTKKIRIGATEVDRLDAASCFVLSETLLVSPSHHQSSRLLLLVLKFEINKEEIASGKYCVQAQSFLGVVLRLLFHQILFLPICGAFFFLLPFLPSRSKHFVFSKIPGLAAQ